MPRDSFAAIAREKYSLTWLASGPLIQIPVPVKPVLMVHQFQGIMGQASPMVESTSLLLAHQAHFKGAQVRLLFRAFRDQLPDAQKEAPGSDDVVARISQLGALGVFRGGKAGFLKL